MPREASNQVGSTPLSTKLAQDGMFAIEQSLQIVRTVAESVRRHHGSGMIHGNISIGSVSVDREGRVFLTKIG